MQIEKLKTNYLTIPQAFFDIEDLWTSSAATLT